jgi:hypothetical protein
MSSKEKIKIFIIYDSKKKKLFSNSFLVHIDKLINDKIEKRLEF